MDLADVKLEIDQCNCFTVRKAARRVSRLYEDILQPTGLRITQFLILAVLAKVSGASVNELAERSFTAPKCKLEGGPVLKGQVLFCPQTDSNFETPSGNLRIASAGNNRATKRSAASAHSDRRQ